MRPIATSCHGMRPNSALESSLVFQSSTDWKSIMRLLLKSCPGKTSFCTPAGWASDKGCCLESQRPKHRSKPPMKANS